MTSPTVRAARAALILAGVPGALGAQQNLYNEPSATVGVEARQYNFGSGFGVDHVRQIAVPIAVAVPLGRRFSFDVGTWYANTNVASPAGDESFSSLTDTQVRLAYMFGTDAVVASVMVNLPTGKETTTLQKFNIAASASSNFLLFPVNSYGSGTSVTPGLAAATTVGQWNVGVAASVRWSAEYHPFNDSGSTGVRYQPGVETRIRAGVDRLVGRGRLTFGGTFSTFANDQLQGGSFGNGTYDPGNRFLLDASLLSPVGRGTLSFYVWNYHRTASKSSSIAGTKENIFTAGMAGSFPLGGRTSLEPMVEGRFWSPESGSGSLFGGGAGLRFQLSPKVAFVPAARIDAGSIKLPGTSSKSIFGWDFSTLVRYSF
jgi:hypothetical protein